MAFYKDGSCGGKPDHFGAVDVNSTNQCFAFEGMRSWAFWCEGKGLGAAGNGDLHVVPTHVQGLNVLSVSITAEQEDSFGLAITVYVVASVAVLIGLWVWFGSLILNFSKGLFRSREGRIAL